MFVPESLEIMNITEGFIDLQNSTDKKYPQIE